MNILWLTDKNTRKLEEFVKSDIQLLENLGHHIILVNAKKKPKVIFQYFYYLLDLKNIRLYLAHTKKTQSKRGIKNYLKNYHILKYKNIELVIFNFAYLIHHRAWITSYLQAKSVVWLRGSDVFVFPLKEQNYLTSLQKADFLLSRNLDFSNVLREHKIKISSEKILFFPPTISITSTRNSISAKQVTKLHILHVGRLHEVKDPFTLIKAVVQTSKQIPIAQLTIIGDGPLYGDVTEYIRENNLEQLIQIKGEVELDEVYQSINHHHLYINTSLSEGYSNIVSIAKAQHLFCITSKISGHPITNLQDGLTFEVGNTKELTQKIIDYFYMNENKRAQIIQNAFVQVSSLQTKENAISRWNNLFEKLND